MSTVVYAKGKLGADRTGLQDTSYIVKDIIKLFTSTMNDFHYGVSGGMVLPRHRPIIEAVLRRIASSVVGPAKLDLPELERDIARVVGQMGICVIMVTRDVVLDITLKKTIHVLECDPNGFCVNGLHGLTWRCEYEITGDFEDSVQRASDWSNGGIENKTDFLYTNTLEGFVPCVSP